jgi:acetyltransferase-like isoleucine patch superfamily enzyme
MPVLEVSLSILDRALYRFLIRSVERMPIRLVKLVVEIYTDARVRKLYWPRLGLELGSGSYANLGVRVVRQEGRYRVRVGANVSIAPGVIFVCESTANNGVEINSIPYVLNVLTRGGDIVVEDEAWIGAGAVILPGVTIGRCSVVGASSLILSDVEPYSIYAGAPAKKIRDLRTGRRVDRSATTSTADEVDYQGGEQVGAEAHRKRIES